MREQVELLEHIPPELWWMSIGAFVLISVVIIAVCILLYKASITKRYNELVYKAWKGDEDAKFALWLEFREPPPEREPWKRTQPPAPPAS